MSESRPKPERGIVMWMVYNDCPPDWGSPTIINLYFSKEKAEKRLKRFKRGDPVQAQYLTIKPIRAY